MVIIEKPRKAMVSASRVSPGQFPGEYFVKLETVDGIVGAYFPSTSVDETKQTIQVMIIGNNGNHYLVNLPACTLSTGSRAWFRKEMVMVEE